MISDLLFATTRRATGKSHLLSEGVKNYDRPFMLVCKSIQEGKRLTNNNPNASYITPTDLNKLYGADIELIIFDQEVVKEYLLKILDLESILLYNQNLKETTETKPNYEHTKFNTRRN